MNDSELDRRLTCGDPARSTPASLDAVVDELVGRPTVRRPQQRRRRRIALIAGSAVMAVGGLAAFTDLDRYLLSVPPFSTLDEGTTRTAEGLPYVPIGDTDRGEQCAIWIDFGGLTAGEFASINAYWSQADPDAFAEGVKTRLGKDLATDVTEGEAKKEQLLEDLGRIVPGLAWGSAPPTSPWTDGQPHLTSFSTVCADDIEALE